MTRLMNSMEHASPEHDPQSVLMEATGLRKTFGQTTALRDAGVRIVAGEIVAVMGSSGSGKSTLLHCLAGIVRPDGGEVV